MVAPDISSGNASCSVAVIMERVVLNSRWTSEKWEAKGVVRDASPPGAPYRVIVRNEQLTQLLFPGHVIRLRRDEAEGYYLNITSPTPKIFILWRVHDGIAQPEFLSVSYHEGARWTDGGENVDGVALPVELLPWIGEFVEQHYRPEPKKKGRYASNKDKGVGFHG
ncbi:MAG: DUF3305 domain-containing protein [Betaproteobacteria bacterium]|nr:DUF3305 domain-containing protein [Betaproteobacteria bacterium]